MLNKAWNYSSNPYLPGNGSRFAPGGSFGKSGFRKSALAGSSDSSGTELINEATRCSRSPLPAGGATHRLFLKRSRPSASAAASSNSSATKFTSYNRLSVTQYEG